MKRIAFALSILAGTAVAAAGAAQALRVDSALPVYMKVSGVSGSLSSD